MHMYTSAVPISCPLFLTEAQDILDMSSVEAELLLSPSVQSETDSHVGNTIEQPSLEAGVKPGTIASLTFCLSFILFSTHPCLFPFAYSASIPLLPSITTPPVSNASSPPPSPPFCVLWTLMSRPLRQCGLCLQAVRAGTLPTGTLNGTN